LDLERFSSPEEVASRLWVLASGERIRVAQQRAAVDWQALFSLSLLHLGGGGLTRALLLLLDELVLFLQRLTAPEGKRVDRRRLILGFLRELSRLCLDATARVVVAGSLEIEGYLKDTLGIKAGELPPLLGSLVHFPLPPPTFKSTRLEMRRVLLGTGLVVELEEFNWLVKNADLASPYPALRFLDQLASRARSS